MKRLLLTSLTALVVTVSAPTEESGCEDKEIPKTASPTENEQEAAA
jgi:hypothetical protein